MQRAASAARLGQLLGQPVVCCRTGTTRSSSRRFEVEARAGQGSQVMVDSQNGQQLLKGFTPATDFLAGGRRGAARLCWSATTS